MTKLAFALTATLVLGPAAAGVTGARCAQSTDAVTARQSSPDA